MRSALLVGLTLLASSCRRGDAAVKPVPSADASVSAVVSASAAVEDQRPWSEPEAAWFPARAGELARDLHADVTSFGGPEQPSLAGACALLTEDCEKLERLGLRRVLRVPYIGATASHRRVVATLLRFESPESAYGYFTGRLETAEAAGKPVFSALALAGAAVFGDTTLLAWKADHVLELAFGDERLAPEQSTATARTVLPALATAITDALPGEATPLVSARLLPSAGQKPLSLRFDRFDLAELPGIGSGARAKYGDGEDAYEVALLVRADADAAEDVLETLRKMPGARVLKNAPWRATRVVQTDEKSGRRVAWLFGQKNTVVAGVGVELQPSVTLRKYVWERDPNLLRMKRLLDSIKLR